MLRSGSQEFFEFPVTHTTVTLCAVACWVQISGGPSVKPEDWRVQKGDIDIFSVVSLKSYPRRSTAKPGDLSQFSMS